MTGLAAHPNYLIPMTRLERLKFLELELPASPQPQGWYVPVVRSGKLVFVSGQLPLKQGKVAVAGKVGENLSPEQGREAAVHCLLNILAALEGNGVPLESVKRVVKLTGFVQSAPDFHGQPQVLNAASELLTEIFGDAGRHARAAVGVNALPLNAAVEIEAVFEVA
jgi:enamine deaminase RidA (YjgF/YER057c/UK114 family)